MSKKNKITLFTCLLLVCIWIGKMLYAQDVTDRYNLCFNYGDSIDFKWHMILRSPMKLDSMELINGKYPLCVEQALINSFIPSLKMPLQTLMWQRLPIPVKKKEAKIIVNSKAFNLEKCMLKAICFDSEENVISQDSIDIISETWSSDTLTISLNSTRYLMLGIFAFGSDDMESKGDQKLWLDKMEVLIGGTDYNKYDVPVSGSLKKECIIPLDTNNLYHSIRIPKEKKIIGLGETAHGSESITYFQIELLKKLITEYNCRLVIWETSLYKTPFLNLFLQGALPEESIEEIKNGGYLDTNSELMSDFLLWLRKYNAGITGNKVYFAGCVENETMFDLKHPLFDYIHAFYNDTTKAQLYPLLKCLGDIQQEGVWDYVTENRLQIEQILGSVDFEIFHYIVSRKHANRNIKGLEQGLRAISSRDYSMFMNVQKMIQTRLTAGETAAIVAHLEHTNKKNALGVFPYVYSMGYYLNKEYKNAYFNIGFTIGTGNAVSLVDGSVVNMGYPVDQSLEKLCILQEYPTFYYQDYAHTPLNRLYRSLGNTAIERYWQGNINAKMDAFVFIRESKESHWKKADLFDKGVQRAKLLEKYSEQNKLKVRPGMINTELK